MNSNRANDDHVHDYHTDEASPQHFRDEVPEPSVADNSDLQIRSSVSSSDDDLENGGLNAKLPVWLRESSRSFHFRWVPLPLRKLGRFINEWSKGPRPRQKQRITPFFPWIQEAPLKFVDAFLPSFWHKAAALALIFGAWLLTFSLILRDSASSGNIEGYGKPSAIWCGQTYWYRSGQL